MNLESVVLVLYEPPKGGEIEPEKDGGDEEENGLEVELGGPVEEGAKEADGAEGPEEVEAGEEDEEVAVGRFIAQEGVDGLFFGGLFFVVQRARGLGCHFGRIISC